MRPWRSRAIFRVAARRETGVLPLVPPVCLRAGCAVLLGRGTVTSVSVSMPFVCPVAGVSQYQDVAALVRPGDALVFRHEPSNPYDANACVVQWNDQTVGYVPAAVAARLVATGSAWSGEVAEVLPGPECVGLRVRVCGLSTNLSAPQSVRSAAEPVDTLPVGHPAVNGASREDGEPLADADPPGGHGSSGGSQIAESVVSSPVSLPVSVVASSGRVLGVLVQERPDSVLVRVDDRTVEYPKTLLRLPLA